MNEDRIAEALLTMFGLVFLLFAGLAFWVAIQTLSPWPAFAGIASSMCSYIGFRGAYFERHSS